MGCLLLAYAVIQPPATGKNSPNLPPAAPSMMRFPVFL